MELGDNIKNLRITKGLSQSDLADKLGVKRATVGSWERGRTEPSMKDIDNMCIFFDVDISLLTGIQHKSKDDIVLTSGEKQLIQELREIREIDTRKLEIMFNHILKHKQENGTLKIKGVPSDHKIYMITEDNFLDTFYIRKSSTTKKHEDDEDDGTGNGENLNVG